MLVASHSPEGEAVFAEIALEGLFVEMLHVDVRNHHRLFHVLAAQFAVEAASLSPFLLLRRRRSFRRFVGGYSLSRRASVLFTLLVLTPVQQTGPE